MSARGIFITVEGAEGVGKSTNLAFLEQFLSDRGIETVLTREPGGTPLGEEIRNLLLNNRSEPMSSMTELLLMFAARAQHIEECIEPALAAGTWVLCDRFTDATYAYQSGGRGVASESIGCLEDLVQGKLRPDYTLLLDVPVATGMERARGRGELDRIERETMAFFERVRANYLERAASDAGRYRLVDAGEDLENVQQQIARIAQEIVETSTPGRPAA